MNAYLQKKYHTGDGHEYRYFLQRNATELRKNFSECAQKDVNSCKYPNNQVKWHPDGYYPYRNMFKSTNDRHITPMPNDTIKFSDNMIDWSERWQQNQEKCSK